MSVVNTFDVFKYNLQFWKVLGVIPPNGGKWTRRAYYTYSILINGLTTALAVCLVVKCFVATNLTDFCEAVYVALTCVFCNLKLYNTLFIKTKLFGAKNVLEKLDCRATSNQEVVILRKAVRMGHNCFRVLTLICCLIMLSGQMYVLLSNKPVLMFSGSYPYDWRTSTFHFWLTHVLQTYQSLIVDGQVITSDTYPAGYFCILSAHIRVLSIRIRRIGSNPKKTKDQNYEELIAAIKDHLITLDLSGQIQDIISSHCLAQFISTGAAQATICFYLTYGDIIFWKWINSIMIFFGFSIEVLLFCYFGSALKSANDNLSKAIYSCNWVDQDIRFKKALLLLLVRSQKPPIITAGRILPVDLVTFVKVMKTTYSFFALLNSVN